MGKTTSQKQIRMFEKDILKIRNLKKRKENGIEESDAEVLARIVRELDAKICKSPNIQVKFDGVFR
jgi:hypothetical protein